MLVATNAIATSSNPRCNPPIAKGDILRGLPMVSHKRQAIERTHLFWQWGFGVTVKDVKIVG